METNIKDDYTVYADINDLLEEISTFLNNELQNGKLSQNSKNTASILIQKSKIQLNEISKIIGDNYPTRYVDMKGPKGNSTEYIDMKQGDEVQEMYAYVEHDEQEINEINIQESPIICPYVLLPAQAITSGKFGFLERKEKFFLSFLEHQKKLYAGIYDGWLLLYNCEKDQKPFFTCNLKFYEAKALENTKATFELRSKKQEKTQVLTASAKKDMVQWVHAINSISKEQEIRKSKSPTPDIIEEEKIYEELNYRDQKETPTSPRFTSIKPKEKPILSMKPILPPRVSGWNRQKSLTEPTLTEPTLTEPSQEIDIEEMYVTVQPHEIENNEDDENIYDDINAKCKVIPNIIEEDIYDSVQYKNDYDRDSVFEEYHEIENYDQVVAPPVKPKLNVKKS